MQFIFERDGEKDVNCFLNAGFFWLFHAFRIRSVGNHLRVFGAQIVVLRDQILRLR